MNKSKILQAENGLTTVARSVLSSIATERTMDKKEILLTVKAAGCTKPQNIIYGCVSTLTRAGLLREPTRGNFIRVKASPGRPKKISVDKETQTVITIPEAVKLNPHQTAVEPIKVKTKVPRDPMEIIMEMRAAFDDAMFEISEYYEAQKLANAADSDKVAKMKAFMDAMK